MVADKVGTNVTTDYLHGAGVDEHLRQTSNLGNLYFTQDHLGSTSALTGGAAGLSNG